MSDAFIESLVITFLLVGIAWWFAGGFKALTGED